MKKNKNLALIKEFLRYLIPSVSAMWFFSIYTMIDGMFVGLGVGPLALAAVNLSMPFINKIFAVSIMVAVGSSTLITYYLGKNNKKLSNEIFTLNFIILSTFGILITVLSLIFLDEIVSFLGATTETVDYMKDYLRIIISFSSFFLIAYSLEVLVKADDYPIYSTVIVILSAVINIVFDYILIIHYDFGIKGAAIATGLSQFAAFVICLKHFLSKKSNLKFVKVKLDFTHIKKIFVIGTPEALIELSAGYIIFIFNFVLLKYVGPMGISAFGVVMYINNLILMTMIGVNQSIQPLISFYQGKQDYIKTKKLFYYGLSSAFIFSLAFFTVSQVYSDNLVSFFISNEEQEIFHMAVKALKIFSFSFLIIGFNVVINGYFTALKFVKKAVFLSLVRGYIITTLVVIVFPNLRGEIGIWLSPIIYELITLVISIYIYAKHEKPQPIEEGQIEAIRN